MWKSFEPSKLTHVYFKQASTLLTFCSSEPGSFDVRLTVQVLKTSTPHDPESALMGKGASKLVFTIHSPQATRNLVFSIPHRLLVIGLRRKAIQGVETIADLLEGSLRSITWKPEFRNKPILLAGGPRGLSVREDLPCASIALTEYLARRALNAGYGPGWLHSFASVYDWILT